LNNFDVEWYVGSYLFWFYVSVVIELHMISFVIELHLVSFSPLFVFLMSEINKLLEFESWKIILLLECLGYLLQVIDLYSRVGLSLLKSLTLAIDDLIDLISTIAFLSVWRMSLYVGDSEKFELTVRIRDFRYFFIL